MIAAILAAVMALQGVSTFTVDSTVYVEGRPGCTVQPLYNDPRLPVVVCEAP